MAILKNGRNLGKLGDTTTYVLNGKIVTRLIGRSNKPISLPQKRVRLKTRLLSKFLNPIKEFIQVGYEEEGRRLALHAQNPAFAYNWRHGFKGEFPKISLDYRKILLTFGSMPVPKGVQVVVDRDGLLFSWDLQENVAGTHWSDQVMLMAYFPKLNKAIYLTAGTSRYKGKDLLSIFDIDHGEIAETYIAFIANDRKSISNSVYTGKVKW
ncbi:DUF6266 family protein [Pedobacter gandavensis]|uniref:DUF6266 family protein n=1 Tax=Pedobacter gandavensis TaxID=2679963 RepID=UPI00292DFB67|nr:DUF6266 family protein [Pedobacter gandavensis]